MQTIETERLLLRPMTAQDIDALLIIFADPKVMASFNEPPFVRAQMEHWVNRNLEHQTEFGYGLFSVIHKESSVLIGDCGLEQMSVDGALAAELGYDFRSDYWKQGYATEAARAVRDYAFQTLNLSQLISLIRVGNEPSRRVAERVGMALESEYEKYGNHYWKFALTQTDWNGKATGNEAA